MNINISIQALHNPIEKIVYFKRLHAYFSLIDQIFSGPNYFQSDQNLIRIELNQVFLSPTEHQSHYCHYM